MDVSLQEELNQLKSVKELETQNAKLMATNEAQTLILEAYQQGLQAGFSMAKGIASPGGMPLPRFSTPGSGTSSSPSPLNPGS